MLFRPSNSGFCKRCATTWLSPCRMRALGEAGCGPGEVLARLNDLMVQDFPSGKFVTMVYAVLDPASRKLTFANAGHLRPLLVTNNGARFIDTDRGMPLGLAAGGFSEVEIDLSPGSRLVFYSDGITEAAEASEEEYGPARLERHVVSSNASPESILEDVRSFVNGAGLQDDATVIFIKA